MRTKITNPIDVKPIATSAIVVISVYIAAQLLSDIGSLKIARVAGFSILYSKNTSFLGGGGWMRGLTVHAGYGVKTILIP